MYAFEYLESARSRKIKIKRLSSYVRKRLTIVDLCEGLWPCGRVFATIDSASPN